MGELLNISKFKNMNAKDIVTDYDALSERCEEFDLTKSNTDAQTIIVALKRIIRSDDTITGLSANQIGYNKRVLCLNFNGDIRTFINPIIEKAEGLELSRERCHSLPGKEYIRLRHTKVSVTYQTPLAKIESVELVGMAARVMQHHIDHLDGLLLSDVGLEIDESWDAATEEERQEVIDMYLDSLDLNRAQIEKDIADDKDAAQIANAVKFITSVQQGKTKIEHIPLTDAEIELIKQYDTNKKSKEIDK